MLTIIITYLTTPSSLVEWSDQFYYVCVQLTTLLILAPCNFLYTNKYAFKKIVSHLNFIKFVSRQQRLLCQLLKLAKYINFTNLSNDIASRVVLDT